jgi:hypothetical protein
MSQEIETEFVHPSIAARDLAGEKLKGYLERSAFYSSENGVSPSAKAVKAVAHLMAIDPEFRQAFGTLLMDAECDFQERED